VAAALEAMVGRRALLIGDCMLDAYLFGETARVSREAPVLVVREERREHRLGGAANTAANLAALGLEVDVLCALGDDEPGRILRQLLADAGCALDHVLTSPHATAIKTRILAGAFGTSRQQVLRLDREPAGALPEALHVALAERLEALAEAADVVVVSDYGSGTLGPQALAVLQRLAAAGKPVCVDSRYALGRFVGMTALTPNVPEAEALVGHALHDRGAIERGGRSIVDALRCRALVLTQGKQGMSLFEEGHDVRHVDIVGTDEVTDVTGAGDSVIATLGAALAAGLGMHNGALLANCAAGIVVTRMGTAAASPADIVQAAAQGGVTLQPWAAS
jgi:rfaE bifunctional protein kinase chain/domain